LEDIYEIEIAFTKDFETVGDIVDYLKKVHNIGVKRIQIICTVRKATPEYLSNLEKYVACLESKGHIVHLPHRDVDQNQRGIKICQDHRDFMESCDEVHVFYSPDSQGTHFDLGMAFALKKKLVVVDNVDIPEGKSYARMIKEWENEGAN
jgi:hypothetical protein